MNRGDVAVDVLRVFAAIGRISEGARLVAERGLLGEVVLALGGITEEGSRLGALLSRRAAAVYVGVGTVQFPGDDSNYVAGLMLYNDCIRAFCAAYSLEEIVGYLEGMAGFMLSDRAEM